MMLSAFFGLGFFFSTSAVAETKILYQASPLDDNILSAPVDADATDAAKSLYDFMYYNYGRKTFICSMAEPVWDTTKASSVYQATGRWPVMACFDLMHLCYSPCDWIDYGDITPVSSWHSQGGAVSLMWHWQVPESEGSTSYTSTSDKTTFTPSNIDTEGSWEHKLFYTDLYEAYTVIKALQDAGIPVLWRPFHEASGNASSGGTAWFWWGKSGADNFKSLWRRMYAYFEERDIHNLIWVWTSCDSDADWYPGDEYVDVVSTDIYAKDLDAIIIRHSELSTQYPSRMVALSECGQVPVVSTQQTSGVMWSWVMPWYGNSSEGTAWASDEWWSDAVGCYDSGCDISLSADVLTDVAVGDTVHVCVTALGIGGEAKAVFQTPQYENIPGTIEWPVLDGDFELLVTSQNVDIIKAGMLVRGMNYIIKSVELRKADITSLDAVSGVSDAVPVSAFSLDGRRQSSALNSQPSAITIVRMSDGTVRKVAR